MWWESWQLGSVTASQVKHQKMRNQIGLIIETDYASMKLCVLLNHQDLLSLSSCRMHSAKLFVGRLMTAPLPGSLYTLLQLGQVPWFFPFRTIPCWWFQLGRTHSSWPKWIKLFEILEYTFKQWTQTVYRQGRERLCRFRNWNPRRLCKESYKNNSYFMILKCICQ